eukprot:gene157-213_t
MPPRDLSAWAAGAACAKRAQKKVYNLRDEDALPDLAGHKRGWDAGFTELYSLSPEKRAALDAVRGERKIDRNIVNDFLRTSSLHGGGDGEGGENGRVGENGNLTAAGFIATAGGNDNEDDRQYSLSPDTRPQQQRTTRNTSNTSKQKSFVGGIPARAGSRSPVKKSNDAGKKSQISTEGNLTKNSNTKEAETAATGDDGEGTSNVAAPSKKPRISQRLSALASPSPDRGKFERRGRGREWASPEKTSTVGRKRVDYYAGLCGELLRSLGGFGANELAESTYLYYYVSAGAYRSLSIRFGANELEEGTVVSRLEKLARLMEQEFDARYFLLDATEFYGNFLADVEDADEDDVDGDGKNHDENINNATASTLARSTRSTLANTNDNEEDNDAGGQEKEKERVKRSAWEEKVIRAVIGNHVYALEVAEIHLLLAIVHSRMHARLVENWSRRVTGTAGSMSAAAEEVRQQQQLQQQQGSEGPEEHTGDCKIYIRGHKLMHVADVFGALREEGRFGAGASGNSTNNNLTTLRTTTVTVTVTAVDGPRKGGGQQSSMESMLDARKRALEAVDRRLYQLQTLLDQTFAGHNTWAATQARLDALALRVASHGQIASSVAALLLGVLGACCAEVTGDRDANKVGDGGKRDDANSNINGADDVEADARLEEIADAQTGTFPGQAAADGSMVAVHNEDLMSAVGDQIQEKPIDPIEASALEEARLREKIATVVGEGHLAQTLLEGKTLFFDGEWQAGLCNTYCHAKEVATVEEVRFGLAGARLAELEAVFGAAAANLRASCQILAQDKAVKRKEYKALLDEYNAVLHGAEEVLYVSATERLRRAKERDAQTLASTLSTVRRGLLGGAGGDGAGHGRSSGADGRRGRRRRSGRNKRSNSRERGGSSGGDDSDEGNAGAKRDRGPVAKRMAKMLKNMNYRKMATGLLEEEGLIGAGDADAPGGKSNSSFAWDALLEEGGDLESEEGEDGGDGEKSGKILREELRSKHLARHPSQQGLGDEKDQDGAAEAEGTTRDNANGDKNGGEAAVGVEENLNSGVAWENRRENRPAGGTKENNCAETKTETAAEQACRVAEPNGYLMLEQQRRQRRHLVDACRSIAREAEAIAQTQSARIRRNHAKQLERIEGYLRNFDPGYYAEQEGARVAKDEARAAAIRDEQERQMRILTLYEQEGLQEDAAPKPRAVNPRARRAADGEKGAAENGEKGDEAAGAVAGGTDSMVSFFDSSADFPADSFSFHTDHNFDEKTSENNSSQKLVASASRQGTNLGNNSPSRKNGPGGNRAGTGAGPSVGELDHMRSQLKQRTCAVRALLDLQKKSCSRDELFELRTEFSLHGFAVRRKKIRTQQLKELARLRYEWAPDEIRAGQMAHRDGFGFRAKEKEKIATMQTEITVGTGRKEDFLARYADARANVEKVNREAELRRERELRDAAAATKGGAFLARQSLRFGATSPGMEHNDDNEDRKCEKNRNHNVGKKGDHGSGSPGKKTTTKKGEKEMVSKRSPKIIREGASSTGMSQSAPTPVPLVAPVLKKKRRQSRAANAVIRRMASRARELEECAARAEAAAERSYRGGFQPTFLLDEDERSSDVCATVSQNAGSNAEADINGNNNSKNLGVNKYMSGGGQGRSGVYATSSKAMMFSRSHNARNSVESADDDEDPNSGEDEDEENEGEEAPPLGDGLTRFERELRHMPRAVLDRLDDAIEARCVLNDNFISPAKKQTHKLSPLRKSTGNNSSKHFSTPNINDMSRKSSAKKTDSVNGGRRGEATAGTL